jgi:hypothetical protein
VWGIPSCRSQDFVPRSRYCLPNIIVGDYKIVRPKGTPLPALKYKYQGALVPLEPPPEVITEKKTSTALKITALKGDLVGGCLFFTALALLGVTVT